MEGCEGSGLGPVNYIVFCGGGGMSWKARRILISAFIGCFICSIIANVTRVAFDPVHVYVEAFQGEKVDNSSNLRNELVGFGFVLAMGDVLGIFGVNMEMYVISCGVGNTGPEECFYDGREFSCVVGSYKST